MFSRKPKFRIVEVWLCSKYDTIPTHSLSRFSKQNRVQNSNWKARFQSWFWGENWISKASKWASGVLLISRPADFLLLNEIPVRIYAHTSRITNGKETSKHDTYGVYGYSQRIAPVVYNRLTRRRWSRKKYQVYRSIKRQWCVIPHVGGALSTVQ